jgi:hypothetical protein
MPKPHYLQIAGIPLTIQFPPTVEQAELPLAFRAFKAGGQAGLRMIIEAEHYPGPFGPAVFDTPPIWSLHRPGPESVFRIYPGDRERERTLVIPDAGETARLWVPGACPDPFFGPALELLTITHLARGHGAVIHGCAIAHGGKGWVFVGESGAGKSTLSRLWAGRPGVEVLSDDRAIVRREGGRFTLHGTPWHGEARFGAPGGVPLERIFFIRHGSSNKVKPTPRGAAVRGFLKCAFPPFWDASGTGFALEFFDGLAAAVPCVELFFVPDRGAVDFVRASAGTGLTP